MRRRDSYGNVEEMLKRKREEMGLGTGEEEIFRNSKKAIGLLKSPELRIMGREGKIQDIMKGWRADVQIFMREMRSMKRWKDEIRNMKEEVKEGVKEQGVYKGRGR